MNMGMKLEMSLRNHNLALNAQFNMVEVLETEIKSKMHSDMTLETLSQMFSLFKFILTWKG